MQEQKKQFLLNFAFAATIFLLFLITFKFLFSFFLPFIIAFVIAYFVQKPSAHFSKKTRIKREICAVALSLFTYIFLITFLFFLIYYFLLKAKDIFSNINGILNEFSNIITDVQNIFLKILKNFLPEINLTAENIITNFFEDIAKKVTLFFSDVAGKIVKKTPSFLFSSIVTLVATCYISKDFNNLILFYKNLFGEKVYSKSVKIKKIVSNSVFKFIKGYALLMLITYAELIIGLYFLRIKYAFILALIISLVDLLPVLGTGTILVPWGLAEILLGNTRGIWLLILYSLITVIRNFAEPKIIGKQIGINPLFTLISMFLGLRLIGFLGLLLFPVILIVVIEYYKDENLA